MAASSSYKTYMRILEKWPIDSSKKGRDIGEYIRHRIKVAFGSNQILAGSNEEDCQRAAESLQRLANNQYGKAFQRVSRSSSTGLTAEQCSGVLSSDFMESIQEEDRSFVSRLFGSKN